MDNESLSTKTLEKFEMMSQAVKVKLFHRLRIIELNKTIGAILANAVGGDDMRKTKAKIIHQLYDGNFKKDTKYSELQSILESGHNFYDFLDAYTTEAYANYYVAFVKHAANAKNFSAIESAMDNAFRDVQSCVQTNELRLVAGKNTAIPSAMLQPKYRKAIIALLEDDLQTDFSIKKFIKLAGRSSVVDEEQELAEFMASRNSRSLRDVRNLERYEMGEGVVFYLDPEGEFYTEDEVTSES